MIFQWLKRHKSKIFNAIFYSVLITMIAIRAPSWIRQFQMQGTPSSVVEVLHADGSKISLPPGDGKPSILIFWATWCGPCTMELKRFAAAVDEGELDRSRIFAISLQEDPELVQETAVRRRYPFSVYADPSGKSGSVYKVEGTPTVVHLDGQGAVRWVTSGLSPTGIWRAKRHLAH